MNIQSGLSGHWTDEQIIEHLYGGGPENSHILNCPGCLNRLSGMQQRRGVMEEAAGSDEPSAELLAAQRRSIYARLTAEQNRSWRTWGPARWGMTRWVSAATVLLAIGGGLFLVEENSRFGPRSESHGQTTASAISDSQLAAEVGQMADSSEPASTEPLQALFAE